MPDRDQQLIEAAMGYLTLLDGDNLVSVDQFVATADPELRGELRPYLEEILALGAPGEPPILTPAEQELVDRVSRDSSSRVARALTRSVFASLREVRAACKLSLVALAQQLNLPPDLLDRIERHEINLATIPARLIIRLAVLLDRPETEIRVLLGEPPNHLGAAQVREASQPYLSPANIYGDVERSRRHMTSFAEALEVSQATPAQRDAWDQPE
jgi:transcriptional regulator with XRE-family HTH domain